MSRAPLHRPSRPAPARTRQTRPVPKSDTMAFDRRQHILVEAARLFAAKGFEATSVREIAQATGILAGSLYYHFASKEELFVAVHAAGMEILIRTAQAAIRDVSEPWDRLAAAAAAHCTALLESSDFMLLVVPDFPQSIGQYRAELIRQRDAYEAIIAALVAALDLPAEIDPKLFRLHFIGALNWTQSWYRPSSGLAPAEIGRQLVAMLRPSAPRTP
jgi:TetR/AcrR family transcriptional regulator, cholesterol catabolism regulator